MVDSRSACDPVEEEERGDNDDEDDDDCVSVSCDDELDDDSLALVAPVLLLLAVGAMELSSPLLLDGSGDETTMS